MHDFISHNCESTEKIIKSKHFHYIDHIVPLGLEPLCGRQNHAYSFCQIFSG